MTKFVFCLCFILIQVGGSFSYALRCESLFAKAADSNPVIESKKYGDFSALLAKTVSADQSLTKENLIKFIKDVSQEIFSRDKISDTELIEFWNYVKIVNIAPRGAFYVKRFAQTAGEMIRDTLEGSQSWFNYSSIALSQPGSVHRFLSSRSSTEPYFPFKPSARGSTPEIYVLFEYIIQYQILQRIESNPDLFIQSLNVKTTDVSSYTPALRSIRYFFSALDKPARLEKPAVKKQIIDRSRPRLGQVQGQDTPIKKQCGGTCYLEAVIETVDRELRVSGGIQYRLNRPQLFARWLVQRISKLNFSASNLQVQINEMMQSGSVIQFIEFLSGNLKLSAGVTTAEAMQKEDAFIQSFTNEIIGLAKTHDNKESKSSGLILLSGTQTSSNSDFQTAFRKYVDWLKTEVSKVSPTLSGFENKLTFKKADLSKALTEKPEFQPQIEEELKNRLNRGRGVMVRFHILNSLQSIQDGRAGFYDIQSDKLNSERAVLMGLAKDENLHFGAIIDYIEGGDGRIEYLVMKNSWGSENFVTDNGYIYLSVRYLSVFGRELYFTDISP